MPFHSTALFEKGNKQNFAYAEKSSTVQLLILRQKPFASTTVYVFSGQLLT